MNYGPTVASFDIMPPPHEYEPLLQRYGACASGALPANWFFSEEIGQGAWKLLRKGVEACNQCPVRAECQVVGDHVERGSVDHSIVTGVWGGEISTQRIARRKAARAVAA